MKTETSHIWIGRFSENAPSNFFEERHDREDDEAVSLFAQSQGELWYDHDFMEISYVNAAVDIAELVAGHSYSEQYLDAVLAAAKDGEIDTANVFVLASESEFALAVPVSGDGYELWYLGKFTYNI